MIISQRFTFTNTLLIVGSIICALILTVSIIKNCPFLYKKATTYALATMEESFGHKPLNSEHEQFVKNIAHEMGIDRPVTMRLMNTAAMQTFGYYNAFAAHHLFANIIPIVDTSFLFISEDFFATISPEEQRFLIGHELVHIQKQHLRYSTLLTFILAIFLAILFWFFVKNRIVRLIQNKVPYNQQSLVHIICIILGLLLCDTIPDIIHLAYRRHIEWEADIISTNKLVTHTGGINITERWIKNYYMQAENPLGSLLSDHPSPVERRSYFLAQKKLLETHTS